MNLREGWEGLSPAQNNTPRVDEIDLLYGKLFKSAEGQKVLNHLRAITIEQPTWYPGEDASYGYVREGMAELVRKIEKRVENSNNG